MRRREKLNKKLLISLLMSLAVVGNVGDKGYSDELAPVPTLTQLHNSGTKIPNTDIIYPQSAYSISIGSADDYNITTQTYDTSGNLTTNYYKVNVDIDGISPEGLIWNEVSAIGTDTIEIALPNNDKKYFHYTYKAPDGYTVDTSNGLKITNNANNNLEMYYIRTPAYTNTKSIDNLKGTFIYSYGYGYNTGLRNSGNIKNLQANFISNWNMYNSCKGAALYNSSIIRNIIGDFIGNYIGANGPDAMNGGGAALYNDKGTIDNIVGDFIGNHSITNGGAIYNNNGSIGEITGNFISNYNNNYGLQGDAGYAHGGAIYNLSGVIEKIIGNFINNYSESDSSGSKSYSYGGAIYNSGQMSIINSSFYNNYAKTEKTISQGGAIYTTTDLNIIADDGTSTFRGNYTDTNGTIDDNAIYVEGADTTLTLNAKNNGEIFMHDNIRGTDGYNININGDGTGILHLYNNIHNNANVITDNITIDMADNTTRDYNFKSLKSDPSTNYIIDVDLANDGSADTIAATNPDSGLVYDSTVTLSDINVMNIDSATEDNYKIQVLKTNNDYLQLALDDNLTDKEFILRNTETEAVSDEIKKDAKWDDKFETYNVNTSVVGKVSLDTTNTTNDSINFNTTGTKTTKTDNVSLGDTLALVNQLETEEDRSFSFDSANDKYNVSQNLGETSSGKMIVNGVADENNRSEINLNGHNGFELVNESSLTLNNTNLTGNNTLITVNNPSATINLQNAILNGNISAENTYTLNINGTESDTTVINGTVGAADATLDGGNLNFNTDTFKDAEFTTLDGTVDLVTGKIENYTIGTLNSAVDAKYNFDIDVSGTTPAADTLTTGENSSGTVTVSQINFINETTPDSEFTVQLLNSQNDDIQLAVEPSLAGKSQKLGTVTKTTNDTVLPTINWQDKFYSHTKEGTNYGNIELATTNTTNDSLALKITNTQWQDGETTTSLGDSLALLNQLETSEDRNFNFDTSEDVYELSSDLGTTSAGTLNINGKTSETGHSTINGNNYNMFVLSNPTNLNLNSVKITGANAVASGSNKDAVINLNNVEIKDNKSGITTAGSVNISGKSLFDNNGNGIEVTSDDSIITLNGLDGDGYDITFKDKLSGVAGAKLNLKAGQVEFHKSVTNLDINMDRTTANLKADNVFDGQNLTVAGVSNINMINNSVNTMQLNSLTLNDNLNLGVDVDLANKSMDRISAETYTLGEYKVNVSQMNLLSDAKEVRTDIQFADDKLKNNVTTSVSEVAYSPIYKYGVNYNKNNGEFEFTRNSSSGGNVPPGYNDLNPSVMASPVAAQIGGYMGLLDNYNNAFSHMDMYMLKPASLRAAEKNANKYAIASGSAPYSANETNTNGIWIRPYTGYDSVGLKRGPKVYNMSYGSFIGGDFGMHEFDNGFTGSFSPYISYQGAHQSYAGNSVYQNGGSVGFAGTLHKGNFFTGITAGIGASVAEANTMYGNEDFPMLITGVASKTGYNIEFKEGKFIIQPSLMVSYSFVNNFDYTNAAGVKIDTAPLHAVQIAPSLRFSFNTKNYWQPYAFVGMNWNIMNNDGNFRANDTILPELSIKPYIQYGVGIQKLVSDNFTAFAQIALRNGGRNGVAGTLGMKYLFGSNNRPQQEVPQNNVL